MFCLVRCLFVISTSAVDCPERFVTEMAYYVLSGTSNLLTDYNHQIETDEFVPMGCYYL